MTSTVKRLVLCACIGFPAAGCEQPTEPDETVEPVEVSGAVQKGPFILGAQVQLNVLDSVGNPTGAVFNTTTTNARGEFSLSVDPSVVDLVTDGFYYDEIAWRLSGAAISMRALIEIGDSGPQVHYVNALTHITHPRALALFAGGVGAAAAAAQAQMEAYDVFPWLVPPDSAVPASQMNLLGGDDASNAYLLAMSCGLGQLAFDVSDGTDNDAQLQQLINNIAADLEADGVVSATLAAQLEAGGFFDPYECVASLQARLDEIGDTETVLPDPQLAMNANCAIDDADDPVVSLAVFDNGFDLEVMAVLGGSGRAVQLVSPYLGRDTFRWAPVTVADGLEELTDVEEAVPVWNGVVIRRSDGTVQFVDPRDNTAAVPYGPVSNASAIFSSGDSLLAIDLNGDFTTPGGLTVSNVARVAGSNPYFVYLDTSGGVHVIEGDTVTDVGGLEGITVIDVAAISPGSEYVAVSEAGAMYRFSATTPTAVEDATVTGITSLHVSTTVGPANVPGRLFAVTAAGVWDLRGRGTGDPTLVTDLTGMTSFHGPVTWGESGIYAYVATDTAGNVQLVHYADDLTVTSAFRPVCVPR